ncbi:66S pre-ribosomal particles component [Komagataella phaffii CBS 7435]|uniref:Ribosome biogenesis protein ERB1 n=2 Tax=Komagataella phaffii TaxID=460519 RepID=C4QXX4_KOMPG|nr:uncharacterized protein PAS_chr1-4_0664 [Komagataella phaffii GS115]AOA61423.1 GQ67_01914T0 [Komagataella phaffii]CAH2446915.1 66S pre-ribosomal particles component [Komagataella phaffii CBS 7435]AOA66189.1 GQ68_01929T0 [Komagataella phaffii GS115]CAY68097.1 hypothetical protein PAS_chr1-4_0664 [Komagataella phaffii GS115]CCA37173.1 66S pre-ribosomal particles component [Komagataella phaffii CBS 7435]
MVTRSANKRTESARSKNEKKRAHEEPSPEDVVELDSSEEEFDLDGLIDEGSDDEGEEDDADEHQEEPDENDKEDTGLEADEEPELESDSDVELNKMLAQEEGDDESSESDAPSEPQEETSSLTDKVKNIKIRSYSEGSTSIRETTYSDGKLRLIRPEIDPKYESDDSEKEEFNTVGNIPLSAYEEFPHIGYDINGKRIMRPAKGSALEQLLESIDLPAGWTGLLDRNTGGVMNLTQDELELIRRIQSNELTDETLDPYEDTVEWFSSKVEVMPLSDKPEPKRRFVPSQQEQVKILKLVTAIREGRIVHPDKVKEEKIEDPVYDLWQDAEDNTVDQENNWRAPKLAPPTHEESYNPPEEYLFTEKERKEWEETDPSERKLQLIPQKFTALRKVPGYANNIKEIFERSLDLYLAPRVKQAKLNVDPDSLIPELPSPKDLRPFPIRCSTIYEGHSGRIRALSVHPSGIWLATGADDGTVRVWEVVSGREVFKTTIITESHKGEDFIECIAWNPAENSGILAIAAGEHVYLIVPPIFGFDIENAAKSKIEHGFGYAKHGNIRKAAKGPSNASDDEDTTEAVTKQHTSWFKPTPEQADRGISLVVSMKKVSVIKKISWHRKGDYFVTSSPNAGKTSVLVHQLSRHISQAPFNKSRGVIMDAKFHPFKPQLFVVSQRYIRIYDLQKQVLVKKLVSQARWLASIDIHPRGDNVITASYDKRVLWHDLDLSSEPYKTMRYHQKAVRAVAFHKGGLPLFGSASDDGTVHIFHGTVYDDLMSNPLLVPLKKLTGHRVIQSLGVLNMEWHPKEAWVFTSGADATARLWTT